MRLRIAAGVAAAWILAGIVLGAQNSLGATLRGGEAIPLGVAVRNGMIQTLPWIPVTLAIIALAVRFPLSRERWPRHALVHLLAAPALAFAANVLVVLGFWGTHGTFAGFAMLARQGAVWAMVNFLYALLIYAAVLAATHGVLWWRAARERELRLARLEGQLARAHVQALTAQIRPHFLFNTLHTIGQLWRSGRSDQADAVLDHLGALFHKVQQSTARLEVPLAEELELVREYLGIEQARFRDRLRASIEASEEALGCLVPPLVLQPLVENAIRHGISAVSAAGVVEVRARVEGDALLMSVRDDGPGMQRASPRQGSGTGLRNTRERLAQLYGAAASLHIAEAEGGGTIVRLRMPRRVEDSEGAAAAAAPRDEREAVFSGGRTGDLVEPLMPGDARG